MWAEFVLTLVSTSDIFFWWLVFLPRQNQAFRCKTVKVIVILFFLNLLPSLLPSYILGMMKYAVTISTIKPIKTNLATSLSWYGMPRVSWAWARPLAQNLA